MPSQSRLADRVQREVGRPQGAVTGAQKKKVARVTIRLDPDEHEQIASRARELDLKVAEYIRASAGVAPRPVDSAALQALREARGTLRQVGGLLKRTMALPEVKREYPVKAAIKSVEAAVAEVEATVRRLVQPERLDG